MADDEIKKLPPEERIKKLKELEEKRKKEIEEAHQIIRQSEDEIKERRKWAEKVPIPQVASEDFKSLSAEEKEIVRTHRGIKDKDRKGFEEEVEESARKRKKESELEEITREQARQQPANEREALLQSQYLTQLSQQPARDIYQEMMQISQRVEDKGYISREEERRIEYLNTAMEKKMEDIESGRYSFTSAVGEMASTARSVAEKMRDLYRR